MLIKSLRYKKISLFIINIFAAIITVFGFAPYNQWLLALLGVTLYSYCFSQQPTPKNSAICTFIFYVIYSSGTCWWISHVLKTFGEMPSILAYLIVILASSTLALMPTLLSFLFHKIFIRQQYAKTILLLPIIWILSDFFNSWFLSGFTWQQLGYTQIESCLSNIAPIMGVEGITLLMFIIGTQLAFLINKKELGYLIAPIACFLGTYILGTIEYTDNLNSVKVALMQGNIETETKWHPDQVVPTLRKYYNLISQNTDAHIILLPESAIPALENDLEKPEFNLFVMSNLDNFATDNNFGLITGFQYHDVAKNEYYNGIMGMGIIDSKGEKHYQFGKGNRYYKRHLVPIGEYIPFKELVQNLGPIFNMPMNFFTHGAEIQDNIMVKDLYVASAICYEIIFNNELRAQITPQTNLIATISNDGWFNYTNGPIQHLTIARMRAKEFSKPIIRATNNGITAIIDHKGNIQKTIPQNIVGALKDNLTPTQGITPFAKYGRLFMWIIIIFGLCYALYRKHIENLFVAQKQQEHENKIN